MDCVIVSDAWITALDHDLKYHPTINQLNSAFAVYLESNLCVMRNTMNIYHDACGYPLMDQVNWREDTVVNGAGDIADTYDNYYICGFHLGRCTHKKAFALATLYPQKANNIFIINNLSMLYPSDTLTKLREPQWFPLVNYSTKKGFYQQGVPTEQSIQC